MRQKLFFFFFTVFLLGLTASAQQAVTVKSFTQTTDHIPGGDRRNDYNDTPCALVKVQVVDDIDRIESNSIGAIINKGVEKWVYMCKGSRNMTIHLKNFLPVEVQFRSYGISSLESNRVYKLELQVPTDVAERELRREELRLASQQQQLQAQRQQQQQRQQTLQAQQQQLEADRQAQQQKQLDLQEQQQRLTARQQHIEAQRSEQEAQRLAQQKQQLDLQQQRLELEKQKTTLEQQRLNLEQQQSDMEQQRLAQEQQQLDLEQQRLEQTKRQWEEDVRQRELNTQRQQLRHDAFLQKMKRKSNQSLVMGLEGGANIAQAYFSGSSGTTSSVTGLHLGFTAEFRITNGFYLSTGLLYSGKGYKYISEKNNVDEEGTAQYLDLPVLASARIPLGGAVSLDLNAGPYMALCIGGDVKDNWKGSQNYKESFSSVYSSFDYGAQIGIGLNLAHHYHLGVDYQLGMASSYSNRTLSLGVGYRF